MGPLAQAMRGKTFVEYDKPYDVGVTGLLGVSPDNGATMLVSCA
jgi:hypothetical protein